MLTDRKCCLDKQITEIESTIKSLEQEYFGLTSIHGNIFTGLNLAEHDKHLSSSAQNTFNDLCRKFPFSHSSGMSNDDSVPNLQVKHNRKN